MFDKIEKSGPLDEILQISVTISVTNSHKKSLKDFYLTFFIFDFFEHILESGQICPPPPGIGLMETGTVQEALAIEQFAKGLFSISLPIQRLYSLI